jgi:hypothetical protein
MPFPFQIIQSTEKVVIAYQFASASRTIPLGRATEAPVDSWMGWSNGHWEGDTLVVDVTDQLGRTWLDRAGNFYSEAVHVVERYTPIGPDHLMYEATIEDSNVFTRPWTIRMPLYRRIEENTELFADPVNITLLAKHITRSGIVQMALQTKPESILWVVRDDGVLVGYSFELAEQIGGWHRHPMGDKVKSVGVKNIISSATVFGEETQEVWLIVERGGVECLELMRPLDEQGTTRKAVLTVDSAVRYAFATATTVFTNLGHLEGRTVRLVAREETTQVNRRGETETVDRMINVGTAVVQSGQVTIAAPGHKRMDIGLDFVPRARTLPPEMQTQTGSALARQGRWQEVAVDVYDTIGLTISGVRIEPQETPDLLDTYLAPRAETLRGSGEGSTESPQLTFEQFEPFPATILTVSGELELEEVE